MQEARVIQTYDIGLTQELHIIRAHQLHYSSLLDDFRKTVEFIRDTKNPAMDAFPETVRMESERLMQRECKSLWNEIDRLEKSRSMQEQRLTNITNLVNCVMHLMTFPRESILMRLL